MAAAAVLQGAAAGASAEDESHTFSAHVGVRHLPAAPDATQFESEIDLAPHLLNRAQVAHGGLIATLIDSTMARAAGAAAASMPGRSGRFATVEMKVAYLGPGRGRLRARGWCLHRTASLTFCEAEVRDAQERLVAKGSATFKHAAARARAAALP